jgi:hypothetical protein
MIRHVLKCEQPWFQAVWDGAKPFEVRKNDRDFQPGDTLVLRECWLDDAGETHFTGRETSRVVTYVLRDGVRFGIPEDVVVLGMDQSNVKAGS